MTPPNILASDGGGEAEQGVVGDRQRLIFRLEGQERPDRKDAGSLLLRRRGCAPRRHRMSRFLRLKLGRPDRMAKL